MKQVIQSFKTGELTVSDVPAPSARSGGVLVRNRASLVSAGTERMVVDFAEKNLLQKARSRPDLVRQTLDKAKREGVLATFDAVQNRLDKPMSLGYSSAGAVLDVGERASQFQINDRVACAGGGYAVHAEAVWVPKNLVIALPDEVDFESAAFTTLGAIALQGIRLSEVRLRDVAAVIGLGLLGQLAVQMLKAAGAVVIGMDIQPARAELARKLGADAVATDTDQMTALCEQFSSGHGADVVLITADTKSNQPLELAGHVARDKGTVVAVGSVGMTIPRKVYYEKELDFRISRSYGPGRYDHKYEEEGHDYPYGYVRWTEQRNMQAFVQLLAEGKVDVRPLVTHRFSIDDAPKAYEVITGKTGEPFLGVVLTYPDATALSRTVTLRPVTDAPAVKADHVGLGVLGAGNFATATMLPALKDVKAINLVGVAASSGLSARAAADRFGFAYCTTDAREILNDSKINTVAILTRHNLHARQVIEALEARRHVFVEKPLCMNEEELQQIVSVYTRLREMNPGQSQALMVGFNRRFAPFVVELKRHLERIGEPLMVNCRVNAGFIPLDHWTQDAAESGGRLIGEGCHFIDLLTYLTGDRARRVTTRALPDSGRYAQDNFHVTIEFAGGSIGTVTYVANGDKGFGKEFFEVFGGGLSASLDDYRTLFMRDGGKSFRQTARLRQDKGHKAEWQAFAAQITSGGAAPIAFDEIVHSMRLTFAARRSLQTGEPVIIEGD
ncbi:MAG TPA: bi-domain-containing oxidoreductase [Blastocatellia bacterium]|nr:bi-domain-containing oxidoreductase [Blastocatellia bacterium]